MKTTINSPVNRYEHGVCLHPIKSSRVGRRCGNPAQFLLVARGWKLCGMHSKTYERAGATIEPLKFKMQARKRK